WIVPDASGLRPRYDQKPFDSKAAAERFVLLAAKDGRDGAIEVHQDMALWMTRLGRGETRALPLARSRQAWVHLARGAGRVNGHAMDEGDGAAFTGESAVDAQGTGDAELLVFDLA